MNDFFSILGQLGWALTVGALTAAAFSIAKLAGLAICVLAGGGCAFWWWRKRRNGQRAAGREPGE